MNSIKEKLERIAALAQLATGIESALTECLVSIESQVGMALTKDQRISGLASTTKQPSDPK